MLPDIPGRDFITAPPDGPECWACENGEDCEYHGPICPECDGSGEGRPVVDPDNVAHEAHLSCGRCGGSGRAAPEQRWEGSD